MALDDLRYRLISQNKVKLNDTVCTQSDNNIDINISKTAVTYLIGCY